MLRVREVLVVEGKYDAIRLRGAVDALILETNGFQIFNDKEQRELLRRLAMERGLLILTDSDSAGFVIRNYLNSVIPNECIKHAFIPEIRGKERRKAAPSKEGLLGVEGVDASLLIEALRRAGATFENDTTVQQSGAPITKQDFFEWGLTGGEDSADRRRVLLGLLDLPTRMTTNRLLEVLNAMMTREQFLTLMNDCNKS